MVAISSFLEYFKTGICTQLEGPGGAYDRYETAVFQRTVLDKLDVIIDNLEAIKKNQYMMYDAIVDYNRQLNTLTNQMSQTVQSLARIENNTSITAYYSRVAARNTQYLAWIEAERRLLR